MTPGEHPDGELSDLNIRRALVAAISRADRERAGQLLDYWAARHGYAAAYKDLLEPALKRIGRGINSERFSLAQAYVAAKVAEDMLTKSAGLLAQNSEPNTVKGPVVLGNAEEDFHALGRRMVATMLRSSGWVVCDLGNDVPAAEFVDKAIEIGARVIGVSAMTMTTALNIKEVRRELDVRGLSGRIQLAVGGAVFLVADGLCDEVGGDGTAPDMLEAPHLFADLWARGERGEDAR